MQVIEHLDTPSAEERGTKKRMIKGTRSQTYLIAMFGLGLPLVFWLLFFLKLEEISGFIISLLQTAFFWLPPIIFAILLFFEEREVYYLKQALEKGITHFSGGIVEKVNIPSRDGVGFKHLNSFSVRIRKRWYYVDRKTCKLCPLVTVSSCGVFQKGDGF